MIKNYPAGLPLNKLPVGVLHDGSLRPIKAKNLYATSRVCRDVRIEYGSTPHANTMRDHDQLAEAVDLLLRSEYRGNVRY